jgi:hypothetical protein
MKKRRAEKHHRQKRNLIILSKKFETAWQAKRLMKQRKAEA